jgi:hypothetical protein
VLDRWRPDPLALIPDAPELVINAGFTPAMFDWCIAELADKASVCISSESWIATWQCSSAL